MSKVFKVRQKPAEDFLLAKGAKGNKAYPIPRYAKKPTRIIGTKVFMVELDPETAQKWLDKYSYDKQRPLARRRIDTYAQAMAAGYFSPTEIKFAVFEGQRYLINARHRLEACVKSGKTVTFSVMEVEVADMDSVGELYYREDRGKARSFQDMVRATGLDGHLGITARETGIAGSSMRVMAAGYRLASSKFSSALSDDQIEWLMQPWKEPIKRFFNMLAKGDVMAKRRLARAPIVAVAIKILRDAKSQSLANSFWQGLIEQDGLRKGDPRKTLWEFLLSSALSNKSNSTGTDRLYASVPYMCRAIAQAWNAHVTATNLPSIKVPIRNLEEPLSLLGTIETEKASA